MQYMLAMLPLVGCVEGGLLYLWCRLSGALGFGACLFAAGMTALPILLTGGIHLDGFCDTVDALSSHAPPEKKREILKDPRAGAFAVIYVGAYLLSLFGLYTELPRTGPWTVLACLIPVLGRVMSGFSGVCFPVSGEKGLLSAFHHSARKRAAVGILTLWLLLAGGGALSLCAIAGVGLLCAMALCGCYVYRMSQKQFGGMSGDLAGYLYEVAQLAMLAVLILTERMMTL